MLADKDFEEMCEPLLKKMECIYTVTPGNVRALPAEDFSEYFRGQGIESIPCASVREAVELAMSRAGRDGHICAFGSFYYMGELRREFGF